MRRGLDKRFCEKRFFRSVTKKEGDGAWDNGLRKRKRRSRIKPVLFIACLTMAALFLLVNSLFSAPFVSAAEQLVRQRAAALMQKAVNSVMNEYSATGGLALSSTETLSDGSGAIHINSAALAVIAGRTIEEAQRELAKMASVGVKLPAGTVSGVPILSGIGPELCAIIEPIGAVTGSFTSAFTSAGVNQTLYSAKLELTASVRLILAGTQRDVEIKCVEPVLETLVIGSVPHAYTDVSSLDDALNLIPTDAE